MKLAGFFGPYLRRYVPWAAVALGAVLLFAATTAAMLALIEPIFSEVLLAGDQVPMTMRIGMKAEPAPEAGTSGSLDAGSPDAGPQDAGHQAAEPKTFLKRIEHSIDLADRLHDGYEWLKRRLGIDDKSVVYFVPLLFVLIYAIRSLASFVSGYSFQRVGLGVTTDIRNDLYKKLLEQSSRFHAEHASGGLVSRVVNDVTMMQVAVSNRLLDFFQQSVTLITMLVLLISINSKLALICLVVTPVILYPIIRFGKGIRGTSHRSQERMADLAQLLAEGIRGHRVVKAFGMEGFELQRFSRATNRHLRVNLRAQVLANLSSPVIETLAALGSAGLLIYAGQNIRAGNLSVSVLVQFLTTLLLMYDPIRRLNKVNLMLQEALAAAHRVADLMALPNEIVDHVDGPKLETVAKGVRFEGVFFGYDQRQVLHGIDLEIGKGEMVALVGSSGAGKSTLVNLLPRFFDPDDGRVTIDGVDIKAMPLQSLRALIGIVTQDTVLFDDSVRHNIAYGRDDLPIERVREAAAAAYADDFIMGLPDGYDTLIGEGGLRLSGGQRQRLAIARALLKDAPILILDEATSALDSEAESHIQAALEALRRGRTTLVIA
ncbi:MAG: ABC transporter ATP-binding protein, partial [Acidobacteria bacterium]|nr:ABC transporter ATP-binding protein [Acidobacteriota bacterium]